MRKITPHLWFEKQVRDAAEFYISLLPGSRLTNVTHLSNTPSGDCEVVSFELDGEPFMAIGAGPLFRFNPSVSFRIDCGDTAEVDAICERLSDGGKFLVPLGGYPFSARFAWIEDRYGLSWQAMHVADMASAPKVTPVLMFVGGACGKAEEAVNLYGSVFVAAPGHPESETRVEIRSRYEKAEEPNREGTVSNARLLLAGREFGAMDSALDHKFAFNEAISFMIPCDTQEEIDYFWEKLAANPEAGQCGWLKDKYGVSWQVIPAIMRELMSGDDRKRIDRVTQAFLKMKKFDIAALKRAASESDG